MLTALYLLAAIASSHAFTTIAEKGPKDIKLDKSRPDGIYFIPSGSETGLLTLTHLGCEYINRYYPPTSVRVAVKDNGGYALVNINKDLSGAEIRRTGSILGTAQILVNKVCALYAPNKFRRSRSEASTTPSIENEQRAVPQIDNDAA